MQAYALICASSQNTANAALANVTEDICKALSPAFVDHDPTELGFHPSKMLDITILNI